MVAQSLWYVTNRDGFDTLSECGAVRRPKVSVGL